MKNAIALTMLLGLCSLAAAASADDALEGCLDKARSTTERRECIEKDYRKSDAVLNAVYQDLLKQNAADDDDAKETRRRLVEAQRAWLKYRDAQCIYAGSVMLGGTEESVLVAGCVNDLTKARVKELKGQ